MEKFWGFINPDGSVGTRNHLLILSSTIYSNGLAERVAKSVYGAVPIIHPLGRAQTKSDIRFTFKTLVGTAKNPNVGGVVVLDHFMEEGNTAEEIAAEIAKAGKPVEIVNIRNSGGTLEATTKAIRLAMEIARKITLRRREEVPLKQLLFGLNCGTSDTTSGISSNPALGYCSDLIIAQGGRSILAELTELMGAEEWLASRAVTKEAADKIWKTIADFEKRILATGEDIRGTNPTGDNIAGGITTIEEKSLGAAKKSGKAPIQDVIEWGQTPPEKPGVYIMATPGHGAESITGIAAGGAQLLVFSTGGGHTISHPIMPTIKVTGNPFSAGYMKDTVDLDISGILEADLTIEQAGEMILKEVLEVASGKITKSEFLLENTTGFAIHRIGMST
ncbi:MAG: UxaA family hydrolase [Peptococcaceae bacterium]